jgi:hypothetical protein
LACSERRILHGCSSRRLRAVLVAHITDAQEPVLAALLIVGIVIGWLGRGAAAGRSRHRQ